MSALAKMKTAVKAVMAATTIRDLETVRVVVRVRPLNKTELADNRGIIVTMNTEAGQCILTNPNPSAGEPPKAFTFDTVFDESVSQREVYDATARPIVESVLDGYNGTIFAYGQTGTGKTHTMEGAPTPELQGIIPNSFSHVFEAIQGSANRQYLVRASFLEIYNEEIRDLLSKNPKDKLELKETKESGVYVKGLNAFVVKSVPEIKNVLEVGKKNRSVGFTLMNQDSSRSHSIFTITIECIEQTAGAGEEGTIRVGKLNLVDLAGSERQSKTGATGDRLKEATKINLSLSALGNVISALVDGKSGHVPYRDSKLTRLLQDSLGGNTKTVMVANVGPADWNYDETLSTLRYANRAKNIKNKPRINEDPKDAMLREFQEEIARLRAALIRREAAARVQEEEARQEAERQRLAREAARIERKKAKMEAALAAKAEDAERARAEKEALLKKLRAMEGKILKGEERGGLLEVTRKKEEEIRRREAELEKRRREEAAKAQQIAEMEEAAMAREGKYNSKAEEVESKTKKMRKLHKKVTELDAEVEGLYSEFQREKDDLLESIRFLNKQMLLKDTVIEAFIPAEEVQKVIRRAHWDDEGEVWVLERLSDITKRDNSLMRRPVSAAGARRPVSEYARLATAAGDLNPRFKGENILSLELDLPERTTYDYAGPGTDPRVQAAIHAAFADDGELLFVGSAAERLRDGDDVRAMELAGPSRPGTSAGRPAGARPGSARGR